MTGGDDLMRLCLVVNATRLVDCVSSLYIVSMRKLMGKHPRGDTHPRTKLKKTLAKMMAYRHLMVAVAAAVKERSRERDTRWWLTEGCVFDPLPLFCSSTDLSYSEILTNPPRFGRQRVRGEFPLAASVAIYALLRV